MIPHENLQASAQKTAMLSAFAAYGAAMQKHSDFRFRLAKGKGFLQSGGLTIPLAPDSTIRIGQAIMALLEQETSVIAAQLRELLVDVPVTTPVPTTTPPPTLDQQGGGSGTGS